MSLPALEKFLRDHPAHVPSGSKDRQIVVIADSKGRYLQDQTCSKLPESDIIWHHRGGRTTNQAVSYVKQNIENFIHRYGRLLLVIWTGTCDLTRKVSISSGDGSRKVNRFVDLSGTTPDEIIAQYQHICELKDAYGDLIQVLILECPYYSITIWNSVKGHKDISIFEENNRVLHDRISELNDKIRLLNESNGVSAPKFSLDLLRSRKSNKSRPVKTPSYSLLLDGIHPTGILSRYWVRKLVLAVINRYCYQ